MEKITNYNQQLQEYWDFSEHLLRARLYKVLASNEAVNDVLQDLAILALTRKPNPAISSKEEFLRWARIRCRWLALDWIETHRANIIDSTEPATEASPEDIASANELWSKVLKRLPGEQLNVVKLRLKGYTATESGAKLGKKPATVRSLWRHAKKRIIMELTRIENE